MQLSKNLSEAFNAQVNAEMWSSNLYLSMAVYFKKQGLNGFAHWMQKQADEESEHAHDMIDFCLDRGGNIEIQQVNVVPTGWGSALEVFEHVYKHETYVSELIDLCVDANIIKKAGAWFSYEGEKIGQGKEAAKQYIKNNPDFMSMLEEKLKAYQNSEKEE